MTTRKFSVYEEFHFTKYLPKKHKFNKNLEVIIIIKIKFLVKY